MSSLLSLVEVVGGCSFGFVLGRGGFASGETIRPPMPSCQVIIFMALMTQRRDLCILLLFLETEDQSSHFRLDDKP